MVQLTAQSQAAYTCSHWRERAGRVVSAAAAPGIPAPAPPAPARPPKAAMAKKTSGAASMTAKVALTGIEGLRAAQARLLIALARAIGSHNPPWRPRVAFPLRLGNPDFNAVSNVSAGRADYNHRTTSGLSLLSPHAK